MNRLRFVVSLITQESDYQLEQAEAAQQTARRLDVDVQISYADNDAIKQSQQLFEVIQNPSSGVNALILEPAGSTAFPQVAQAALAAGMGWVVMNRDDASIAELRSRFSHPIFAVNADQEETGRILGRQIANLLPQAGTVLCIQGPSANPVSKQRMAGMSETKPDNINLKLLRSTFWTEAGGYQAIKSWLSLSVSHDDSIAGVVAQSDLIALGAHRAFLELTSGEAKEKWASVPFLGVNGLKVGQNAVRNGVLASTVEVPPSVVPAIELLVRAYRETSRPPERTLVAPKSYPALHELAPRALAK
ncbi:MAG TPA: sugar ABC transporter substrate-binding protein [Candidatus Acidoferrales bacterium]|nr:sugar ABC transporter substrate-binding protein [Candidatus Acidoferrales bacterium]